MSKTFSIDNLSKRELQYEIRKRADELRKEYSDAEKDQAKIIEDIENKRQSSIKEIIRLQLQAIETIKSENQDAHEKIVKKYQKWNRILTFLTYHGVMMSGKIMILH